MWTKWSHNQRQLHYCGNATKPWMFLLWVARQMWISRHVTWGAQFLIILTLNGLDKVWKIIFRTVQNTMLKTFLNKMFYMNYVWPSTGYFEPFEHCFKIKRVKTGNQCSWIFFCDYTRKKCIRKKEIFAKNIHEPWFSFFLHTWSWSNVLRFQNLLYFVRQNSCETLY